MITEVNKPNGSGIGRIFKATVCSFQGFRAAYKYESAFRQELIMALLMLPVSFLIGNSSIEVAMLIGSLLLLLIVEILNSAIETVVDRVGLELHELSGRAKDLGSAAVFLALLLVAVTWFGVIYQNYLSNLF